VDPSAPSDAWAQLKSILSIGGKTADLFKIGTGITQTINNSITTTPTMTASLPWSGIILNKSTTDQGNNYWLNTGQFRVGSSSSFLYWDGSNLYTTGKINATGGSFTGDVQLNGGSLYTGPTPNSGARVRFNSGGIYGYDSTSTSISTGQTFMLDASTGLISAQKGSISGWSIDGTKFSQNGATISSTGYLSLGAAASDQIVLSAVDTNYRLWIGNNNGTYGSFKVDKNGVLYAQGAQISGNIVIGSGATLDAIVAAQSTANSASGTASSASTKADNASAAAVSATTKADNASAAAVSATTKADNAFTAAQNALPSSSFNRDAIVQYINSTSINPTNTTTIEGGLIRTGTISANAVVADFISAFSIDATKITAGTLTGQTLSGGTISGGSISIGSSGSDFLHTNYPRYSPTTTYLGPYYGLGINAIAMISANTSGVISNWYPYLDAESNLGLSSYRWVRLYATTTTISTSDKRLKNDIQPTDLGLNFIKDLNPSKFKMVYKQDVPLMDGENVVLDADGSRVIKETISREGTRYHYGLVAQDVKQVLDNHGVGDTFAGWALDDPADPNSRQGLAYEDFISPLIKAVQELSNMVESLQQEVSELKGK